MQLDAIFEKVKLENARSKEIHGFWAGTDLAAQNVAIFGELVEWNEAQERGDVDGKHGEIAEAIQAINTLCRRIMLLTGETNA